SGYADATVRGVEIPQSSPARLVLEGGSVISGSVRGLPAELRAWATVTAASENGGTVSTNVDGEGAYRLEHVPAGPTRISARRRDPSGSDAVTSPARLLTLGAGEHLQIDIIFEEGATIRGTVTRNGEPLGGASVLFDPLAGSAAAARTATDSGGHYSVSGLDDGAYRIQVGDPRSGAWFRSEYEVRGSAGHDLDFHTSTLTGRVLDAAGETPLPEATLELRSAGRVEVMRSARSAAGGDFVLRDVPPGSYQLSAARRHYGSQVVGVEVRQEGPPPDEQTLRLDRAEGVSVTVTDGRTGTALAFGVRALDGAGRVAFDDLARPQLVAETREIPLAPGSYRMTVGAPGYAMVTMTISAPSRQTVAVTPGAALAIRSDANVVQFGRLLAAGGMPYPLFGAAEPTFTIDPQPAITRLAHLPPGTMLLQVLDPQLRIMREIPLMLVEGETAEVRY
ncbi:MAG: hypothetical protein JWN02_2018, partial [Acidobacteria bacterium]|nr:hypothetical protein [Acidobacteriota bacterium]